MLTVAIMFTVFILQLGFGEDQEFQMNKWPFVDMQLEVVELLDLLYAIDDSIESCEKAESSIRSDINRLKTLKAKIRKVYNDQTKF